MFGRQKSDEDQQPDAVSAWHWRGLLAQSSRLVRAIVALCMLVESVAFTFVQIGFAGISFGGDNSGFLVVLLQPIVAISLLLGTAAGGLFGLAVGGVLYVHAQLMPINAVEYSYIGITTSVVTMAITGLVLALCFAKALRDDMDLKQRFVRMALICLGVSLFYSFLFVAGAAVSTLASLQSMLGKEAFGVMMEGSSIPEIVSMYFAYVAEELGFVVQVVVDAVLMFGSAALADTLARRTLLAGGSRGLRTVFNGWLVAVVFLAFMGAAATSFIVFTAVQYDRAEVSMNHLLDYIDGQFESERAQSEAIDNLFAALGIDDTEILSKPEQADYYMDTVSVEGVLEGYSEEGDGIIFVLAPSEDAYQNIAPAQGGVNAEWLVDNLDLLKVELANTDAVKIGDTMADDIQFEVRNAIDRALATGRMQRVIVPGCISGSDAARERRATHHTVSYLSAKITVDEGVLVCIRQDSMVFIDRPNVMRSMVLAVSVLFLAVLFVITRLLNQVIVRPIDETNDVLARITEGDLDVRVDERESQEFRSLSDGINATVDAMKGWIEEAETRMDAELDTAKAIQEAALPRTFPPFPEILHFDIYASMNPARQVGGDFYDFFLIGEDTGPDEGKLGFVIADVSGKGVPAALFMMAAKTQIRDYLQSGMEPGEAIENANRQLCMGNDASMFVTAIAGVLDYKTGRVEMVNAGHNPPLLWQRGTWSWLRKRSGLPLGLFDGSSYKSFSVDCLPGDQFLLYTDGITEAMDVDDEQYGEERLEQLVKDSYDLHPRMLVDALRGDVAQFTKGAEQSDDITVLALEVGVPPELTANLTVFADIDELESVNRFIHTELDRRLCPVRAQNQLDVAVEELFVNVAEYAYPHATHDNPGKVRVSYTYCAEPPSITVDMVDEGVPFNPLAKPDAVTPSDIMDVPIGGLGILMAKKSVDSMHYERAEGANVLRIVKSW